MIDTKASPNGDLQILIEGKTGTIESVFVSAFISKILWGLSQQAAQSGDIIPEGGAVLHPTSAAVEFDRESGEPRIQLTFGKALFSVAMPAGEMKKIADMINQIVAKKPV